MKIVRALILIAAALVLAQRISAEDKRRTTDDEKESTIQSTNIASFTVIGIEARTTNAKEATPDAIIGKHWQKFFSEGVLNRIPDRFDRNVYAVYSDYTSDHNGEYSFLIGAKVKDGIAAPTGMVAKHIRAGRYAVFTSEKGPFAKIVPSVWQKIFRLEDAGTLKRAYQTDFELYDQRAQDPQNGQVDIYVGVK
jgi:predicted transcriptional regulator YdeE